MTDRFLDDLGRSLARPMTRRRTMRLFLAGGAALALPPLRPRISFAQEGPVCGTSCQGAPIECFPGSVCCLGPPDASGCYSWAACCDPCDSNSSRCVAPGTCGQGPVDPAACCASRGQGEPCGSSGICCTPDQICDPSRGICCALDTTPPKCNEPEAQCKKQADELVEAQKASVETPVGYDMGDHLEGLTKTLLLDGYSRLKEYDRCPQVPDDKDCRSGGRCDPSTLRCRQCADANAEDRSAAATSPAPALEANHQEPRPQIARTGAVSRAELVGRLSARRAHRTVLLRRLISVARAPRPTTRQDPELAKAIAEYRSEIVRLRVSLARGRGGLPQRYALRMCNELARGLADFHAAALEHDRPKAESLALAARPPMKTGIRHVRGLHRLLGCGTHCL